MAKTQRTNYADTSTPVLFRELATHLATMERDIMGLPSARLLGHRLRHSRMIAAELRNRGTQGSLLTLLEQEQLLRDIKAG